MGMRGSATCALNFDRALGWLIGEAHRGLSCMFVMMNAARLAVGLQSVGAGELAHQCALEYTQAVLPASGVGGAPSAPLREHADGRRKLARASWRDRVVPYRYITGVSGS